MKRAATAILIFAASTLLSAQQQPPAGQTPPAQTGQPAQATAAPQQGKRPAQAKTQAEYDAFNAAMNNRSDAAAMEKAADDFAAKYGDSDLRVLMYRQAMRAYQSSNNGDKTYEMAQKALKLDPDDPDALVGAAEVLAERTRDTDLDKDQRWAEAQKDAQHALDTIDTDITIPAGTPQDKVDAYKRYLRSSAYSILGAIASNQEKYPDAENYYRKADALDPSQPDPVVVLRLAIALDKQNKYPDALKEANRAVDLTQESTTVGTLARRERDRLVQLTGGTAPASKPPASGTPNPNPSSH